MLWAHISQSHQQNIMSVDTPSAPGHQQLQHLKNKHCIPLLSFTEQSQQAHIILVLGSDIHMCT